MGKVIRRKMAAFPKGIRVVCTGVPSDCLVIVPCNVMTAASNGRNGFTSSVAEIALNPYDCRRKDEGRATPSYLGDVG